MLLFERAKGARTLITCRRKFRVVGGVKSWRKRAGEIGHSPRWLDGFLSLMPRWKALETAKKP